MCSVRKTPKLSNIFQVIARVPNKIVYVAMYYSLRLLLFDIYEDIGLSVRNESIAKQVDARILQ